MKIAVAWLFLSTLLLVAIVASLMNVIWTDKASKNEIELVAKMHLLETIIAEKTVDKKYFENTHLELRKKYKATVITSQLSGIPQFILLVVFALICLINIVVISFWWFKIPK